MGSTPRLVVGLGNPGRQYTGTRHNAGFWVIDCLSALWKAPLSLGKWQADEARASPPGLGDVILLKPRTFMNESGKSVAPLGRFYKLAPSDVIVVHDDLDLLPGRIQVKRGGSDGGHNGIRSIVREWGEKDFHRVRVGVGRPAPGGDVVGYVLTRPSEREWKKIEEAVIRSTDAVEKLLREGLEAAQQAFNRKAGEPPPGGPAEC